LKAGIILHLFSDPGSYLVTNGNYGRRWFFFNLVLFTLGFVISKCVRISSRAINDYNIIDWA